MQYKEKLISLLNEEIPWMFDDCRSFLLLATQQRQLIEDNKLGLGNYMMTIAMLAHLNFLSKVYFLLSEEDFDLKEQELLKKEINKEIEKIKTSNTKFKGSCFCGEINEKKAFIKLVKNLPNNINLVGVLDEVDVEKLWDFFRNKLSHLGTLPKGTAGSIFESNGQDFNNFMKFIEFNDQHAFSKVNNSYVCQSQLLWRDTKSIRNWLILEVEKFKENRLKIAYDWIVDSLSMQ